MVRKNARRVEAKDSAGPVGSKAHRPRRSRKAAPAAAACIRPAAEVAGARLRFDSLLCVEPLTLGRLPPAVLDQVLPVVDLLAGRTVAAVVAHSPLAPGLTLRVLERLLVIGAVSLTHAGVAGVSAVPATEAQSVGPAAPQIAPSTTRPIVSSTIFVDASLLGDGAEALESSATGPVDAAPSSPAGRVQSAASAETGGSTAVGQEQAPVTAATRPAPAAQAEWQAPVVPLPVASAPPQHFDHLEEDFFASEPAEVLEARRLASIPDHDSHVVHPARRSPARLPESEKRGFLRAAVGWLTR